MRNRSLLIIAGALIVVMGRLIWLFTSRNGELRSATSDQPNAAVEQPTVGPQIGAMAPEFTAKDASGQSHALSEYRGRPVLLNFWASWCPPCKAEMPLLYKAQQQHENRLIVLEVDAAVTERNPGDANHFLQQEGLAFPHLLFDDTGSAMQAYGITGIPQSFFIDEKGMLRTVAFGQLDEKSLKQGLALILQ